jgi:hypothetical protein
VLDGRSSPRLCFGTRSPSPDSTAPVGVAVCWKRDGSRGGAASALGDDWRATDAAGGSCSQGDGKVILASQRTCSVRNQDAREAQRRVTPLPADAPVLRVPLIAPASILPKTSRYQARSSRSCGRTSDRFCSGTLRVYVRPPTGDLSGAFRISVSNTRADGYRTSRSGRSAQAPLRSAWRSRNVWRWATSSDSACCRRSTLAIDYPHFR